MAHRIASIAALCVLVACTAPRSDETDHAPTGNSAAVEASGDGQLALSSAPKSVPPAGTLAADTAGCPTSGALAIMRQVTSPANVRGATYEITRIPRADTEPSPHNTPIVLGRETWHGDLNGDGKTDRIVMIMETLSSYGDAISEVYAGCGGERYREVWGDQYAVDIVLAEPRRTSMGWHDLSWIQRHAAREDDHAFAMILRFNGVRYVSVPGSASRISSGDRTRRSSDSAQ